jgi:glycerophosphoryl diester phosphodiesterase
MSLMNNGSLPGISAIVLVLFLTPSACTVKTGNSDISNKAIDLQGHRGARGLLPENTIPGFLRALELGVDTLEMDVAINADGHIVLSHEPWMSAEICRHPDGRDVTSVEEKSLKIYEMTDQEVAAFDCGSRGHHRFPRQQALPVAKPFLDDVLVAVEEWSEAAGIERSDRVKFSIEIKSQPGYDGIYHAEVDEFALALYAVLQTSDVLERSIVQSFDARALEATHRLDPALATAWLIEDSPDFEKNLAQLSFVPTIYSPYYPLVSADLIKFAHQMSVQVIPWTVNDAKTIRELVALGVDGVITDYPDMASEVLSR